MNAKDLEKIIWPTSVDMMGQIVVAMTFFFLLIFIVLAYYMKQIELRQRVKSEVETFQYLYEPIKKFIAPTEIKRIEKKLPNIDEFILQIQDYLLSVPPSRVKTIKSLIAKRNELIDELYKLGYTGYSANNPFTGDYASMPIITNELLLPQGNWKSIVAKNVLILKFTDNSMAPDRNTSVSLNQGIINFIINNRDGVFTIKVYDSYKVITENLSQRLSLRRAVLIRNLLKENGIDRNKIRIKNIANDKRYTYGALEVSYE